MKISGWSCFLIILFLVVFLLVGLLAGFFVLYVRIQRESEASIQAFCSDVGGFVSYGDARLTNPISSEYNQTTAKFLLVTDLNVTIANCQQFADNIPLPPGFDTSLKLKRTFEGIERVIGYIFYSESLNTILISFTGTFFFDQWESDLLFFQVPPTVLNNYSQGIEIHRGFYNIYLSIRDQLLDNINRIQQQKDIDQIIFTGHSLGGALSSIGAFDFAKITPKPVNWTFASPRLGNIDFASKYNSFRINTIRVFNTSDVVPDLPPPVLSDFLYEHVGTNIPFTTNLGTLTENHIDAYEMFVDSSTTSTLLS